MKHLVVVFIVCMIAASCNPAKKIARQHEQYISIVDAYNKEHPPRIDTTTKYLQGETITNIVERTDTITQYITDTITGATITKYIYTLGKNIFYTRVDTVTKIIVPTAQIELLNKLNEKLLQQKNEAILKVAQNKKWFWLFIIACITTAVFLTTTLKKLF